jgi:NADH-quinone oxidoreductase subunit J
MMATVLYIVLSLLAIGSAVGVLACRRTAYCVFSWTLCGVALSGLYSLLNMPFPAAVQFIVGVCLSGMILGIGVGRARTPPASSNRTRRAPGRTIWYLLAGTIFGLAASWSVARGSIGEPTWNLPPIWASGSKHIAALGQEWNTHYAIPFALLGLLLLVAIAGTTYLVRASKEGEKS